MDSVKNLYAQVNKGVSRQQQQQQAWWQQPQVQQSTPQVQEQWTPQREQWFPQQQQQPQAWNMPQEQQQWNPQQQIWNPQQQQQQQRPSPPRRRSNTPPAQWPSGPQPAAPPYTSYSQQQQIYAPQSSYYPQQLQEQFSYAMYDDGFRAVPIQQQQQQQQQQQSKVPFKKRLSDAIVPEPAAIVASTSSGRLGEASSSSPSLAQRQMVYDTLTEPVLTTLARDAKRVAFNLQQIIVPSRNRNDPARTLRDWDLWGPFFFIIAMSCILSSSASEDKSTVFAVVFAVLSAGAVSLTMNVVLLGGKLNFLQSLSVLGYCLFPLDIGAILCLVSSSKVYRSFVVLVTFMWSSWSVYPFISSAVRRSRKGLAVYPVFLMYISMGFLVLANG